MARRAITAVTGRFFAGSVKVGCSAVPGQREWCAARRARANGQRRAEPPDSKDLPCLDFGVRHPDGSSGAPDGSRAGVSRVRAGRQVVGAGKRRFRRFLMFSSQLHYTHPVSRDRCNSSLPSRVHQTLSLSLESRMPRVMRALGAKTQLLEYSVKL